MTSTPDLLDRIDHAVAANDRLLDQTFPACDWTDATQHTIGYDPADQAPLFGACSPRCTLLARIK